MVCVPLICQATPPFETESEQSSEKEEAVVRAVRTSWYLSYRASARWKWRLRKAAKEVLGVARRVRSESLAAGASSPSLKHMHRSSWRS